MYTTKPSANDAAAHKTLYRKVEHLNRLAENRRLANTAPHHTRQESLEEELEKVVLLCRD